MDKDAKEAEVSKMEQMKSKLDKDDIDKLLSFFGYSVMKLPEYQITTVVDKQRRVVCRIIEGFKYESPLYVNIASLRRLLYVADKFYISVIDCNNPACFSNAWSIDYKMVDIQENPFKGLTPYQMLITYDLLKAG